MTGGDVTVNISWAGMQVATQTQDLCKFLSCPIKAGPITATYQNTMPSFVPRVSGLYLAAVSRQAWPAQRC